MKCPGFFLVVLAVAFLLMYGAGPGLADNGNMHATGNGGMQPGAGGGSPGPQWAQPARPDGNGAPGSNGSAVSSGQGGYGNVWAGVTSQPYSEWQKWAAAYRSEPGYAYTLNFSYAPDKNAPATGEKWFNDSWNGSYSGISKKIAGLRIRMLLGEIETLKTMANRSGLSPEEQAAMAGGIDANARRLEEADKEIRAAGNMESLGQAIARAEARMASVRSEVKAGAGLLACRSMDADLGQAVNASDIINAMAQSPDITPDEKADLTWMRDSYDQHVYDAVRYQANARVAFQKYADTRDDAYYVEGLGQMELSRGELDEAFIILKEVFRRRN